MRVVFWKVRYIDRPSRQLKDRYLYLPIDDIEPLDRAAIELLLKSDDAAQKQRITNYRSLFVERDDSWFSKQSQEITSYDNVQLDEYFEDESGNELDLDGIVRIRTGNPTAVSIPHGAKRHDIELMLSPATPMPLSSVVLSADDLRTLSIFCRDLKELSDSVVAREGPGKLHMGCDFALKPDSQVKLETAFSDDEARSFVTILRRLYMQNEPASFCKAAQIFANAIGAHPRARWVSGVVEEYCSILDQPPDSRVLGDGTAVKFTVKRLIDVFLYTQYAHQPDLRREKQYRQCLEEAMGHSGVLAWLFFCESWKLAIQMRNAGNVICAWLQAYIDHNRIAVPSLGSLKDEHSGLGVLEKKRDRENRLFDERAKELARELWVAEGQPEGGPEGFFHDAEKQLRRILGR